jgi:hypothetical protein
LRHLGIIQEVPGIEVCQIIYACSRDLQAIKLAFGSTSAAPAWNPLADITIDGKVDVSDLAVAGRSYGSSHNFQAARRLSNLQPYDVIKLDAAQDGAGRLHIVWSENHKIFYTRLDRYGNSLIDDRRWTAAATPDSVGIGCDGGLQVWGLQRHMHRRVDQWEPGPTRTKS